MDKKVKKTAKFTVKKEKFYFRGEQLYFQDDNYRIGCTKKRNIVVLHCLPKELASNWGNMASVTVAYLYERLPKAIAKLRGKGFNVERVPFMLSPADGVREYNKCLSAHTVQ